MCFTLHVLHFTFIYDFNFSLLIEKRLIWRKKCFILNIKKIYWRLCVTKYDRVCFSFEKIRKQFKISSFQILFVWLYDATRVGTFFFGFVETRRAEVSPWEVQAQLEKAIKKDGMETIFRLIWWSVHLGWSTVAAFFVNYFLYFVFQ